MASSAVGGVTLAASAIAAAGAITLRNNLSGDEDGFLEGHTSESAKNDKTETSLPSKGLRGDWVLVFRISNDAWQESKWKLLTGPEQIERIDEILAGALVERGGFPRERLNLKIYESWLEFRIAVFNGLLDLLASRCNLKCHIFRSASEGWSGDHINLLVLVRMPESTAREEAMRQAYELPLHPGTAKQLGLADSHGKSAGHAKFNAAFMAHYMDKHKTPLFHKRFGNLTISDSVIKGNVFGMLDRMRLMRNSMAEHVDIHNLIHQDIITAHFPLHNSEELDALKNNWKQDEVQAYFGNGVAFYFAFAGHFLKSLLPLALVGAASEILQSLELPRIVQLLVFETSGGCIVLWGFVYLRAWIRIESYLKLKWTTTTVGQLDKRAQANPRFQGYWSKDPVTGEPHKRQRWRTKIFRRLIGHTTTLVFISIVVVCIFLLFQLQTQLLRQDVPHASIITSVLNAIQIKVFELIWSNVAWRMVDLENYRTLTKRRDALIWKVFSFRAVNAFGASLWISFLKPRDLCRYGGCIIELKVFLASVFATYSGLTIWTNIMFPWILFRLQIMLEDKHSDEGKAPRRQRSFVERQLSMQEYDDMAQIEDYLTIVIQFGLVSLFFTVLPGMAVLAVISIYMQTKSSSWKLCNTYRRTLPDEVASVGAWADVVYLLVRLAVVVNAALLIFTSDLVEGYSNIAKWFMLFASERLAVFVGSGIDHFVSDKSPRTKIMKKRHIVVLERLHNDHVGCRQCADNTHAKLESEAELEYFSPSDYNRCGEVPQYDINDTDPRFLSDQLLAPHLQTPPSVPLRLCERICYCCRLRKQASVQKTTASDLTKATAVVPELSPQMEKSASVSKNLPSELEGSFLAAFSFPARSRLKRHESSASVHPRAAHYQ